MSDKFFSTLLAGEILKQYCGISGISAVLESWPDRKEKDMWQTRIMCLASVRDAIIKTLFKEKIPIDSHVTTAGFWLFSIVGPKQDFFSLLEKIEA